VSKQLGTAALIVVLILLVILNLRFLKLWLSVLVKGRSLTDQKKVLPGARGWVYIGGIFLSIGIVEMLLEGKNWYEGLLPFSLSGQDRILRSENLFPLIGYALVGFGIALQIFGKRNKNTQ